MTSDKKDYTSEQTPYWMYQIFTGREENEMSAIQKRSQEVWLSIRSASRENLV